MLDVILDWWDELTIKSKIVVLSAIFTGLVLVSASWTVYVGAGNVLNTYLSNLENQYVLNSKDSFYKSYSVQKQKQEKTNRDEEKDNPTDNSGLGLFKEGDLEFIGIENPKIPYYVQGDSKWGSYSVRGGTIANSGCGLTSMAMIKSYMTNSIVTPIDIYNELPESDFQGSMGWGAPASIFTPMGCKVEQFGKEGYVGEDDYQRLLDGLNSGAVGMVSFKPGDFTKGGHIAVVKCTDENTGTYINDPNSKNRHFCEQPVSKELMMKNAKRFWLIYK